MHHYMFMHQRNEARKQLRAGHLIYECLLIQFAVKYERMTAENFERNFDKKMLESTTMHSHAWQSDEYVFQFKYISYLTEWSRFLFKIYFLTGR